MSETKCVEKKCATCGKMVNSLTTDGECDACTEGKCWNCRGEGVVVRGDRLYRCSECGGLGGV